MDARHKRWIAALGLFLAWVVGLATMAVLSGHRPTHHHRVTAPPR